MNPIDLAVPLVNAGGFAALSAVLLVLHISSIRQFREEMKEERAGFAGRNALLVAAIEKQTESLLQRFEALADRLSWPNKGRAQT
jgi:hypothetical protein